MKRNNSHRLDEDDVRVRPGRGTRPRTRLRPSHDDATIGMVIAVDRGRFGCLVDGVTVTAMRARELGRKSVVVGDQVAIVGDRSGDTDALARIVRIEPRTSTLRRTADDTDPFERIIVANADQLAIVCAVADPTPRPRLIDRCLVAAFDAGMQPLLVLTKTDLASADELLAAYAPLGVPAVVTQRGELADLRERLADKVTVLVGHSGVGKSTLVNALVAGADRATGVVNLVTGRGRHTSSSAVALPLAGGGWVIDTPGVRSFGLAHIDIDHVLAAFPDLLAGTDGCPRGCTHAGGLADAGECALDAWVAAGHSEAARLDSLRRLLAARDVAEGD